VKTLVQQLAPYFLEIKDKKEMMDFLLALFTPAELDTMMKRIEIVKMLKKKTPQRIISEKLGVGVATITHATRELKQNRFQNV